MSVPTNDSKLIRAILDGEHELFHDLVQRHAAPLWGTVSASIADREEAREILQETWVRAFERLASLREHGRLRSWLLSIALNLVRERARRQRPVSLDIVPDDSLPPGPAPGRGRGARYPARRA